METIKYQEFLIVPTSFSFFNPQDKAIEFVLFFFSAILFSTFYIQQLKNSVLVLNISFIAL